MIKLQIKLALISILVSSIQLSEETYVKSNERIFLLNQTYSLNEVPDKITNCKVKLSNGKYIDLTSLNNPNSPRYYILTGDCSINH